jgi:hypothetical protein
MSQSQYCTREIKKVSLKPPYIEVPDLQLCIKLVKKYKYAELRDKPINKLTHGEFVAAVCYNFYYYQLKHVLHDLVL